MQKGYWSGLVVEEDAKTRFLQEIYNSAETLEKSHMMF